MVFSGVVLFGGLDIVCIFAMRRDTKGQGRKTVYRPKVAFQRPYFFSSFRTKKCGLGLQFRGCYFKVAFLYHDEFCIVKSSYICIGL